jgi:hypothetical protein
MKSVEAELDPSELYALLEKTWPGAKCHICCEEELMERVRKYSENHAPCVDYPGHPLHEFKLDVGFINDGCRWSGEWEPVSYWESIEAWREAPIYWVLVYCPEAKEVANMFVGRRGVAPAEFLEK